MPWVDLTRARGAQVGDHNVQINLNAPAIELPGPAAVPPTPGMHNLPLPTGVFVGRDLSMLDELLTADGGVIGQAVHGLGGIGKTELALHYAHARVDQFRLVWWVTAATREQVSSGLATLTGRLVPVAVPQAQAEAWAVGWLQAHPGWLLVLDNVEDPGHVMELLGLLHGRGKVLVTTRRDLGTVGWARLSLAPMRLPVLDRSASVELLARLTRRHDEDARSAAFHLAEQLGDLPLALEQAAAYVGQHDLDFDKYRRLFAEQPAQIYGRVSVHTDADRTMARVWRVSVQAIVARSALAGRVLAVLANVAPEDLPEDVLAPMADDPLDVADALALLASYNMVSRASGMVGVHRLVQAVTRRDWAAQSEGLRHTTDATTMLPLVAEADWDPVDEAARLLRMAALPLTCWASWTRWSLLLPHIEVLGTHLPADHQSVHALDLADLVAAFLRRHGRVVEAIPVVERTLANRTRLLGIDHPLTATSRNVLVAAYESVGRVDEAVRLLKRTLVDRMRVRGVDNPASLALQNNLAYALVSLDRVADAIPLLERTLIDRSRLLGDDHPDTLTSRTNLAAMYELVGRVAEAIPLLEGTLADRIRVLGVNHPSTMVARTMLSHCIDDHALYRRERGAKTTARPDRQDSLIRCDSGRSAARRPG